MREGVNQETKCTDRLHISHNALILRPIYTYLWHTAVRGKYLYWKYFTGTCDVMQLVINVYTENISLSLTIHGLTSMIIGNNIPEAEYFWPMTPVKNVKKGWISIVKVGCYFHIFFFFYSGINCTWANHCSLAHAQWNRSAQELHLFSNCCNKLSLLGLRMKNPDIGLYNQMH